MWLFSEQGFFSIVAHRDRPNYLLVRARVRADLERLLTHDKSIASVPTIEHTPVADYPYRVTLARNALAMLVFEQVQTIDYPNFKDRVAEREPERARIYHDVWAVIRWMESLGQSASQAIRRRRPR